MMSDDEMRVINMPWTEPVLRYGRDLPWPTYPETRKTPRDNDQVFRCYGSNGEFGTVVRFSAERREQADAKELQSILDQAQILVNEASPASWEQAKMLLKEHFAMVDQTARV